MKEQRMGIDEQIAGALAGRAAQRDFVDHLVENWGLLTDSWNAMVSSAAELARASADARSAGRAEQAVFADLGRYLAPGGQWREQAAAVSALIGPATDSVRALQRRVRRETVNIGVIGLTGAGKSTLLRKLSGLTEQHIPSNRFSSTTATPSRIFHETGPRSGRAVLSLHTWESFRAEVLEPLHRLAKLADPAPRSVADFRRFGYGGAGIVAAGQAGAERYRRRLRDAQDSLPSYEGLLRGGTADITLGELRPYVAYPADGDTRTHIRPYHAVRSVDVFCAFPEVGAVRLGLVDLPGAGEAGLDVHGRFLTELRNHADLLFIVRRPEKAPVTDPDWDAAQLADDAAAGVRRGDFAHHVINRDVSVPDEYYRNALARARTDGERLGIDVRECDIESATTAEVAAAVLSPVLSLLAERLAFMDRDAAGQVLSELTEVVAGMRSLTSQLTSWTEGRQATLPDEEARLRNRAWELKNDLSVQLDRVRDEYDKLFDSGVPIAELHLEIQKAAREMREWTSAGLGAGSSKEWLRRFRAAESAQVHGRELDNQYNGARRQLVAVFGGIDASLDRSVERLWGEVAGALRVQLTADVVPAGTDNRAALTAFAAIARRDGAKTLADATGRLLNLPTDYGSIFLRVGRPVIRKVQWDPQGPAAGLGLGPAVAAGVVGGVTGAAVSAVAGPVVGVAAGHLIGGAASGAAAAGTREGLRRGAGLGPRNWWDVPPGAPSPGAARPGTVPPGTSGPGSGPPPAPAGPADAGGTSPAADPEFGEAARWHARLTDTIERVTSELETEFHAEAQRTLLVLAAAIDLFKETAIATPGVEGEFEKLCRPVQREIWPADFGGAAAQVAADLGALRERAIEADAAASRVAALAAQVPRL
jgi:energy-coupling factor transporter ATP-binding protein EcfA2